MRHIQDTNTALQTHPHYTDTRFKTAQTVFCSEPEKIKRQFDKDFIEGLQYEYLDRIYQWDNDKARAAEQKAKESKFTRGSAQWYEVFLSEYFEKPIELVHVIAGVQVFNGYPWCAFGFRDGQS